MDLLNCPYLGLPLSLTVTGFSTTSKDNAKISITLASISSDARMSLIEIFYEDCFKFSAFITSSSSPIIGRLRRLLIRRFSEYLK